MFKLVIQDDEGKTTVVPLIRDEITIGRKEGNTIRLTERNVSRRHARIVRNNGEVQIEDLGSYNGIRVNNARIAERVSLRISDQVQIGDYKLYLKAEGVEQVDDARTMPIERVDSGSATDIMPAISPPASASSNATTQPLPPPAANGIAAAPGSPAAAQLVGNPARTLVAIGDTDPAGRPVATAATVAALSAPVGYGKLVVLSSNFAGKEFELSRPQMIIGRTDENDICINHRSISRNHAKLVREPETGRYTISDLQSSNGVRVNGQDYGKVELRRGDVVDLGHVRLRFVEPGEDFVFSRDAVITDVPEGSKKGVLVAVVLGLLVLAGVIVFFVTRGDKNGGGGGGSNGMAQAIDAGTAVAVNPVGSGSGSNLENPGSGSDTTPQVATPDAPTETGSGSNAATTGGSELENRCAEYKKDRKWADLQTCANTLMPSNPAKAKQLLQKASEEGKAETNSAKVTEAIGNEALDDAYKAMVKIPTESVYYSDAKKAYDKLESKMLQDYQKRGKALVADKKCKDVTTLINQAPNRLQAELRRSLSCESGGTTGNTGGTQTPPPAACTQAQFDQYMNDGKAAYAAGQNAAALGNFEKAYRCKGDANALGLATVTACLTGDASKARSYYKLLPQRLQSGVQGRCAGAKVTVP